MNEYGKQVITFMETTKDDIKIRWKSKYWVKITSWHERLKIIKCLTRCDGKGYANV